MVSQLRIAILLSQKSIKQLLKPGIGRYNHSKKPAPTCAGVLPMFASTRLTDYL
ncbi:MAG: hypothetical protein ACJ749_20210 [Flavisolibacter sp.]